MPGSEAWSEMVPAWALPVTVPANLVLVRHGGVVVSVGAVCAYPAGFEFYLTIGFDSGAVAGRGTGGAGSRLLGFHAHSPEESASATRVGVSFADGRAADSLACMTGTALPGDLVVRFSGGDSGVQSYDQVWRAESRWWVSPLPPPGPVEFSVALSGAVVADGAASLDAGLVIEAAGRSVVLWPGVATERR